MTGWLAEEERDEWPEGEMPRAGTREGGWGFHVFSEHNPLGITILFCILEGRLSHFSCSQAFHGFNSVQSLTSQSTMGPNTQLSGSIRRTLEVAGSNAELLKTEERQSQTWEGSQIGEDSCIDSGHPLAQGKALPDCKPLESWRQHPRSTSSFLRG